MMNTRFFSRLDFDGGNSVPSAWWEWVGSSSVDKTHKSRYPETGLSSF